MILEAIRHTGAYPDIYLTDRRTLFVTLRTAQGDARSCSICYFSRTSPEKVHVEEMKLIYRDGMFDYYRAALHFDQVARYQKYFFRIETDESVYLTAYCLQKKYPDKGFYEFLYANSTGIVDIPVWARGQVFYQIFPDRFSNGDSSNDPEDVQPWGSEPDREHSTGGDLRGIIDHLDYIYSLGCDCIYLTPVFRGDFNHKYATTDYYDVDPQFGTKSDLTELVDAAHSRGMRVILDGVFNHCGTHFGPFQDVLKKGRHSRYKDWFYITSFPVDISHHDYECVGAYKYMPKLNTGNPEVREYFLGVMDYWIREYHTDGWRMDVADEADEGLWEEARLVIKSRYPEVLMFGETWGSGLQLTNGRQLDAIMNYVFRDAVRDFIATGEIDAVMFNSRTQKMLSDYPEEMDQAMYNLLDSHDTERFLTLCGGNKEKLKAAAAIQMMFPGSPAVYYGDEIGIDGGNDPLCRKCMIWDEKKQDLDLKEYYRKLIGIRHKEPAVRTGKLFTEVCTGRVYGFSRISESGTIITVVNAGNEKENVSIPVRKCGKYLDLLNGCHYSAGCLDPGIPQKFWLSDKVNYQGNLMINMNPYEVIILKEDSK